MNNRNWNGSGSASVQLENLPEELNFEINNESVGEREVNHSNLLDSCTFYI